MKIFIAGFSYGFPKLQVLTFNVPDAKDISFARVLIGHVARADQKLKVGILHSHLNESDLVAWHTFDIILFLLRNQLQIDFSFFSEGGDKKKLFFPLISTLEIFFLYK